MDILDIKPSTITLDIKHPATGDPVGISLELQSLSSPDCKAVERQIRNKALRSGRNGLTADAVEANTTALLCAATVGWIWADGVTLNGEANPACTAENKAALFKQAWLASQVDEALGDDAAFFRG